MNLYGFLWHQNSAGNAGKQTFNLLSVGSTPTRLTIQKKQNGHSQGGRFAFGLHGGDKKRIPTMSGRKFSVGEIRDMMGALLAHPVSCTTSSNRA
ncbi:MAG: hypothetical protein HQM06_17760 [Magnetococcales bacterium]|nr:hypothetical protein [Magnetococcales bacterium]